MPTPGVQYWETCVSSGAEDRDVYDYCDNNFQQEDSRTQCKRDFCNLCCVTADQFLDVIVMDYAVDQCHNKCNEIYQ